MSESLGLKDYLETSAEAAKRVRTTTITLAVATVLLFAGAINSINSGWLRSRIAKLDDPKSKYAKVVRRVLDYQILTVACKARCIDNKYCAEVTDFVEKNRKELSMTEYVDQKLDSIVAFGSEPSGWEAVEDSTDFQNWRDESMDALLRWYKTNEETKNSLVLELRELITLREKKYGILYENFFKEAVENIYVLKVPFFNVAFDINDLGMIGGIGLVIIMILLRLSLRSYIIGLKVGFKNAIASKQRIEFYEILGTRQLFVFPKFRDMDQTEYIGGSERVLKIIRHKINKFVIKIRTSRKFRTWLLWWLKVRGNVVKKERKRAFEKRFPYEKQSVYDFEKVYFKKFRKENPHSWVAYRHKTLRFVAKIVYLLPVIVYFLIIQNDFGSREIGRMLSARRTDFVLVFDLFLWILICLLAFWCVSRTIEVDYLWKYYEIKIAMKEKSENE